LHFALARFVASLGERGRDVALAKSSRRNG
jgi:hypothetical protein